MQKVILPKPAFMKRLWSGACEGPETTRWRLLHCQAEPGARRYKIKPCWLGERAARISVA